VIDAFDAHGDLDFAVTAALRLHRHESQRRGKPHPQNAVVAGALTGDDHGVQFANRRPDLRAAFLRVDEFLQLILVDDLEGLGKLPRLRSSITST